jgi:hypothetical protein
MLSDCWHQLGDFAAAVPNFHFSLDMKKHIEKDMSMCFEPSRERTAALVCCVRVIIDKLTSHCVMLRSMDMEEMHTHHESIERKSGAPRAAHPPTITHTK